jgi:hypothetical protein
MPLGFFAESIFVLHGPAGWEGRLSVNGKVHEIEVPDGDEPAVAEDDGLQIVVVNSDTATRTWPLEEMLIFGPAFVGETAEDVCPQPRARQYCILPFEGKLARRKVKASPASSTRRSAPRLGSWKRISVCTEPVSDDLTWEKIPSPRDVDRLGVHYGYVWYRLVIEADRARRRKLFLPDCADRATVYLNGSLVGTWGVGDGASRAPMSAAFKRGENALTLLVDNLGRLSGGAKLGELKGLFGHVYDAKPLRAKFRLKEEESFSKRIVPRQFSHVVGELGRLPAWSAETTVTMRKILPVHLSFSNVPHHVAVVCNDRCVGFFPRDGSNFGAVTLGSALKKGRNTIGLLLWGDVTAKTLDGVVLHTLLEPLSQRASWSWRPWELPEEGGPVVGKDQPAWYVARFKYAPADRPLFLHIIGARKGQIFLNRRNLGRFWTVGPQQHYYLPECWLEEDNELLIFEESGRIPAGSRLAFRKLGPYRD